MPGPGIRIGLVGKLPAHGDFIRRGDLPASFCAPWDAWLQDGIAAARLALGTDRWEGVWDAAPAWRFALPAGACGPAAVAGVLLPSRDTVGRRFPLTLAAVREDDAGGWPADWFAALEGAGLAALALGQDADALLAALPAPGCATTQSADPLADFWAAIDADAAADDPDPAPRESPSPPAGRVEDGEEPSPPIAETAMMPPGAEGDPVTPGWWTAAAADGTPGLVWPLPALPPAEEFVLLLESEA